MIITGSARKGVLVLVGDEIQARVDRLLGVILALEPSDEDERVGNRSIGPIDSGVERRNMNSRAKIGAPEVGVV